MWKRFRMVFGSLTGLYFLICSLLLGLFSCGCYYFITGIRDLNINPLPKPIVWKFPEGYRGQFVEILEVPQFGTYVPFDEVAKWGPEAKAMVRVSYTDNSAPNKPTNPADVDICTITCSAFTPDPATPGSWLIATSTFSPPWGHGLWGYDVDGVRSDTHCMSPNNTVTLYAKTDYPGILLSFSALLTLLFLGLVFGYGNDCVEMWKIESRREKQKPNIQTETT